MGAMLSLMFLPFGRASRVNFLGGLGAFMLVSPVFTQVWVFLVAPHLRQFGPLSFALPIMTFISWVMFCLFANRLHDLGRSAIWAVAPFVLPVVIATGVVGGSHPGLAGMLTFFLGPVVYFGFAVLLLCFRGNEGPNRFGSRPVIA